MTYVLAAIALLAIGTAVYFGRAAFKANALTLAANDRLHAETRLADEAIAALVRDRDSWKQKADVAVSQLAAAKVRLVTAETQRNAARTEERLHVVETVRAGDAATAIDALGGLLSAPLPGVPKADPASAGHGDSGTAGVPAASAAAADPKPSGLPKP